MSDPPEKRAERAWRTIWRDANGHIADSFPYKPEEDDVILPEIRSAVAEAREECLSAAATAELTPALQQCCGPEFSEGFRSGVEQCCIAIRALAGKEGE